MQMCSNEEQPHVRLQKCRWAMHNSNCNSGFRFGYLGEMDCPIVLQQPVHAITVYMGCRNMDSAVIAHADKMLLAGIDQLLVYLDGDVLTTLGHHYTHGG